MEEADFDLYDALNLERDASSEDVRAAFRNLSRIYHPDKQAGSVGSSVSLGGPVALGSSSSGAESAFMRVHRAYRILGDEDLRSFYDRYGSSGVRLAESLSDDEDEGREVGGVLSVKEDRLKHLEGRVRLLMRKREELQTQRLLGLSGSFTLAAVAAPGLHGAHLRRRYRLQYSATSHSVQIALAEKLKVTVGCASHVQGSNGVGAAKLLLAAVLQLSSLTTLRTSVSYLGSTPEFDIGLARVINDHCTVQQKTQISGDGKSMSLTFLPWLSKTTRANLGLTCGDDPSCSLGLVKRSSSSSSSAKVFRTFMTIQPGGAELGAQIKVKPSRDFSLKLAPTISQRGWALQVTCTKVVDAERLTKLQWVLRVRRRSLLLRLNLCRSGLRFSFPLELWPETGGKVPPVELAVALVVWGAAPLVARGLSLSGQSLLQFLRRHGALRRTMNGGLGSSPKEAAQEEAEAALVADQRAAAAAAAAAAREQRQLIEREALRKRSSEEAQHGLVILQARYGDPELVEGAGPDEATGVGVGVIDVTECLMARVSLSRLQISETPKASLLGFCNPRGRGSCALHIRYRFGGMEYARTFGDTEAVVLP